MLQDIYARSTSLLSESAKIWGVWLDWEQASVARSQGPARYVLA